MITVQSSREDDEEDIEDREEDNDLEKAWEDLMKFINEEKSKKDIPQPLNQKP